MTPFNFEIPKLQVTGAAGIAQELDKKDGKEDGKISASIWNEFVADKGGKTIQYSISIENARKSISTYLYKNSNTTDESKNNIAAEWLMNVFAPKENENKADVPEVAEDAEVAEESEEWADTEVTEDTERLIRLNNTVKKAEAYAQSRRNGNEGITIRANVSRDVVYVDMGQDGNYDIAYDLEGNKIMDLTEGAEPPKGYAKKSVWYNPLTWF